MPSDILTRLEEKLDDTYKLRLEQLSQGSLVPNWDDYNYRIGYLQCIREVGLSIKAIRNPELLPETGEIPSIISEEI